jgi:hypothetical protein
MGGELWCRSDEVKLEEEVGDWMLRNPAELTAT